MPWGHKEYFLPGSNLFTSLRLQKVNDCSHQKKIQLYYLFIEMFKVTE